ncbi:MAG: hypothetical protein JRG89_22885 [Deltaproteobacteria bacterium]|nr:hypothetical protein [Deltaproteobacteria bacterium]MBW2724704.1 hypothetical protein [Deltaproteobacteria bacterium]
MVERVTSTTILVFVSAWVFCATAVVGAAEGKQGISDLEGTWFVLIHYKDSATKNTDADRWLDRVWTFAGKGSRLYWVDYPIVVLKSSQGRFESYKGNPRSRVLANWEPNEGQLAEIMKGPRVNTRGSKSKSLRGSDARGWKSTGRNRVSGANVVGFHEEWSIEPVGDGRKFMITEVLGNAIRGSDEGKTVYLVESSDDDAQEYSGRFDRDGTRTGTFKMFRTPAIRPLLSNDEEDSVNKRLQKRSYEELLRVSD